MPFIKFIILPGCGIILLLLIMNPACAQASRQNFVKEDFQLNELIHDFGQDKKLLAGYELPILVALSYYPELKNVEISFRFRSLHSAGLTTFTFWSFFKLKRHFIITLNDDEMKTGITFKDVPLNAQVGLIGHELAHVVKFMHMTNAGIAVWGLSYLNHKNHKRIERETDETEIGHGLGWQLYDWTNTILLSSKTSPRYKKMKQTFYLQPREILEYLEAMR